MLSKEIAIKSMLGLLSIVILFHFLVLSEIVPYEIVWAGKISSIREMYVFETISILINILLIVLLTLKFKNVKNKVTNKTVNLIIWGFVVLFALNTIGNIFAKSLIEQILGTGLTFISSILCWVIVRKDK